MKHRHALILLSVSLPICVLLRAIQMYFTIDITTGFVKRQYSAISLLITVIICATVASIGLLATTLDGMKRNSDDQYPAITISSVLTGGIFLYQTVAGVSALAAGSWYDVLLIFLALASSFVFIAFGLKNIYSYNLPSLVLVIPVIYYIVRLISIFVSTSALALVTENIFLIFTNSILLWFMFEFAGFENEIGNISQSPKKLFASGLAAIMLCAVTSLPKFILDMLGAIKLSNGDIASALLDLAVGIFMLTYIICKFSEKSQSRKTVGKHSV